MGLFTLVAIAIVHSDNRLTCAIALTLFASGIALSLLLIAAYSRPFTGEISVRPDLLKQVITTGPRGACAGLCDHLLLCPAIGGGLMVPFYGVPPPPPPFNSRWG